MSSVRRSRPFTEAVSCSGQQNDVVTMMSTTSVTSCRDDDRDLCSSVNGDADGVDSDDYDSRQQLETLSYSSSCLLGCQVAWPTSSCSTAVTIHRTVCCLGYYSS